MAAVDRIAEPWGERTPYGPGEPWPVRVDTYLADGIDPDQVDRWVQTASLLHSNGDAMDVAVSDGRIVGARGRAGDRHGSPSTPPAQPVAGWCPAAYERPTPTGQIMKWFQ